MSALHWQRIVGLALPERFDSICVSHEMGFLKPSHQAFETALSAMALPPGEVVFLDDGTANVEAAREVGLIAHVVRSPVEAEFVLKSTECSDSGPSDGPDRSSGRRRHR